MHWVALDCASDHTFAHISLDNILNFYVAIGSDNWPSLHIVAFFFINHHHPVFWVNMYRMSFGPLKSTTHWSSSAHNDCTHCLTLMVASLSVFLWLVGEHNPIPRSEQILTNQQDIGSRGQFTPCYLRTLPQKCKSVIKCHILLCRDTYRYRYRHLFCYNIHGIRSNVFFYIF